MFAASPEIEAQIFAVMDRMNDFMGTGDVDGRRGQFAEDVDIAMIGSADFEVFLGSEGVDAHFAVVREHAVTAPGHGRIAECGGRMPSHGPTQTPTSAAPSMARLIRCHIGSRIARYVRRGRTALRKRRIAGYGVSAI